MNRTGKAAADIFGSGKATPKKTAGKAPADTKRRPGRPAVHEDKWTKVTTVLFNRQIVYLDRLGAEIRAQTGAAVSRTVLIRALVDALEASGLDVTQTETEGELRELLTAKLK